MGQFSDYTENKVLDHVLLTSAFTAPTNLYLALCTADPTDAGTGSTIVEPSGLGYARVSCNSSFSAAAARAITNDVAIQFPEASGAWGALTHWALCDASTAGNMLAYGALTTPRSPKSGDDPVVSIGELDISYDANGSSTYLANAMLDHICKVAAYTQPLSLYVGLANSAITDATTGDTIDEPAAGAYARLKHEAYDAASGGASENTGTIEFVQATASWATIGWWAILDSLTTAANVLHHAALNTAVVIGTSDDPTFSAGAMDITVD